MGLRSFPKLCPYILQAPHRLKRAMIRWAATRNEINVPFHGFSKSYAGSARVTTGLVEVGGYLDAHVYASLLLSHPNGGTHKAGMYLMKQSKSHANGAI